MREPLPCVIAVTSLFRLRSGCSQRRGECDASDVDSGRLALGSDCGQAHRVSNLDDKTEGVGAGAGCGSRVREACENCAGPTAAVGEATLRWLDVPISATASSCSNVCSNTSAAGRCSARVACGACPCCSTRAGGGGLLKTSSSSDSSSSLSTEAAGGALARRCTSSRVSRLSISSSTAATAERRCAFSSSTTLLLGLIMNCRMSRPYLRPLASTPIADAAISLCLQMLLCWSSLAVGCSFLRSTRSAAATLATSPNGTLSTAFTPRGFV